jgi:hypothetical protein
MVPLDRESDAIVRSVLSWSVSGSAEGHLSRRPEAGERAKLVARHKVLVQWLTTSDRKKIGAAIGEMLLGYAKFQLLKSDESTLEAFQEIVAKFVSELNGVPTFAVLRACHAIRTGQGGSDISLVHPPSTIAVYVLAQSFARPTRIEEGHIRIALHGAVQEPTVTPEQRQVVAGKLRRMADELRKRTGPSKADPAETARATLVGIAGEAAFASIPDAPRPNAE